MKKGICFFFGFKSDPKTRAKLIKETGFDCIITNADKRFIFQNGNIKQQVKLFKKNNLTLSSLHMSYNQQDLPEFWKDSKIGDKLEKNLLKDVKYAKKYGFTCVVVHLDGIPSEIGLNRIRNVLKLCEKVKIPLAIENIDNQQCFFETFKNIQNDYLKFCYDIGHNHCFDPDVDYLKQFGDKLIALHLHSNDGSDDQHTLNKYGNINWDLFAKKIAKINPNINLDYEVIMCYRKNENEIEVAKEVYKQACELELMINKYKDK